MGFIGFRVFWAEDVGASRILASSVGVEGLLCACRGIGVPVMTAELQR